MTKTLKGAKKAKDTTASAPITAMSPYQALANAIVHIAGTDYLKAVVKKMQGHSNYSVESEIKTCEEFFHSQYFEMLTNCNGQYLIEAIQKKAAAIAAKKLNRR